MSPRPWNDALASLGYPLHHPYVRRFWTAVLGPGAVADLMRLVAAARRDQVLPRPVHLSSLVREGLVRIEAGRLWVRPTVPPLSAAQVRRLSPALRVEHHRLRWAHSTGSDSGQEH